MENLTLYYFEACPFCQKVLHFLKENQIDIPLKDIRKDPDAKAYLLAVGGKTQVPCLMINGKPLYETDAILAWLSKQRPKHTQA